MSKEVKEFLVTLKACAEQYERLVKRYELYMHLKDRGDIDKRMDLINIMNKGNTDLQFAYDNMNAERLSLGEVLVDSLTTYMNEFDPEEPQTDPVGDVNVPLDISMDTDPTTLPDIPVFDTIKTKFENMERITNTAYWSLREATAN